MYVCMYACTYVCKYARMYTRMHTICTYVCMHVGPMYYTCINILCIFLIRQPPTCIHARMNTYKNSIHRGIIYIGLTSPPVYGIGNQTLTHKNIRKRSRGAFTFYLRTNTIICSLPWYLPHYLYVLDRAPSRPARLTQPPWLFEGPTGVVDLAVALACGKSRFHVGLLNMMSSRVTQCRQLSH